MSARCTKFRYNVAEEANIKVAARAVVQMICDAEMRPTDIVARWPRSTHDSFILSWQGLVASWDTINLMSECFSFMCAVILIDFLTAYQDTVDAQLKMWPLNPIGHSQTG